MAMGEGNGHVFKDYDNKKANRQKSLIIIIINGYFLPGFFFHTPGELLLAVRLSLVSLTSSFSPQSKASHPSAASPAPCGSHKRLRAFLSVFLLQSHFCSYQVLLNANVLIGQVTSDAELPELRKATGCCEVCSVSMAAPREIFYQAPFLRCCLQS